MTYVHLCILAKNLMPKKLFSLSYLVSGPFNLSYERRLANSITHSADFLKKMSGGSGLSVSYNSQTLSGKFSGK